MPRLENRNKLLLDSICILLYVSSYTQSSPYSAISLSAAVGPIKYAVACGCALSCQSALRHFYAFAEATNLSENGMILSSATCTCFNPNTFRFELTTAPASGLLPILADDAKCQNVPAPATIKACIIKVSYSLSLYSYTSSSASLSPAAAKISSRIFRGY